MPSARNTTRWVSRLPRGAKTQQLPITSTCVSSWAVVALGAVGTCVLLCGQCGGPGQVRTCVLGLFEWANTLAAHAKAFPGIHLAT
jgi:hypothetical protein